MVALVSKGETQFGDTSLHRQATAIPIPPHLGCFHLLRRSLELVLPCLRRSLSVGELSLEPRRRSFQFPRKPIALSLEAGDHLTDEVARCQTGDEERNISLEAEHNPQVCAWWTPLQRGTCALKRLTLLKGALKTF